MKFPNHRGGMHTSTNVVTLPGRAPRQPDPDAIPVPVFGLRGDPEQRADFYALANADEALRILMVIATADGRTAAMDLLDNIRVAIEKTFPAAA